MAFMRNKSNWRVRQWTTKADPSRGAPKAPPFIHALLLIITVCLLLTSATAAQQPTATPDPQQSSAQSGDAPVPVPEPSEKALSYYRSGIVLWIVNVLWGLLIPALFLFTGFSARIRDWAKSIGRWWFFVIGF